MIIKHRRSMAAFALLVFSGFITACSGGGSSGSSANPGQTTTTPTPPPTTVTPPPPVGDVVISGSVTFDRVPVSLATNGLDFDGAQQDPIRGVPVEAVNASGQVLASTVTNDNGSYSLEVSGDTAVRIQVRSQLVSEPSTTFNVQVVDNTNGFTEFVLQGSLTNSGTSNSTRNLNAASGWTGSAYTQNRAAAPFAILDSVYEAITDIVAIDPDVEMPLLRILWSPDNIAADGDIVDGDISTSFFTPQSNTVGGPIIAILGAANNDTDEFDEHVVVHEFGHYVEEFLSRSDSIGGSHSLRDRLDLRLAMSEGFGNAYSAIVLENPNYRDTFGQAQQSAFGFDLEANNNFPAGWFNEGSVQSIIYDVFDSASDGPDSISAGFTPIYNALKSDSYRNTDEFTSIFAFADAIVDQPGISQADIQSLYSAQSIASLQSDGAGETNDGGVATSLPVYHLATFGGSAVTVCSTDDVGTQNRLGNYGYVSFDVPSTQVVTIEARRVSGSNSTDPDIDVFLQGRFVRRGASATPNIETLTFNLPTGRYVMQVYEFGNIAGEDSNATSLDACFDVTVR